MKNCSYCSHLEPDDAQFCGKCGQPFQQFIQCSLCLQKETGDAIYCRNCGNPLTQEYIPQNHEKNAALASASKSARKSIPDGCVALILSFLGVLILVSLVILGVNAVSRKLEETFSSDTTVIKTTIPEETMSDEEYRVLIRDTIFQFDDINFRGPDYVGGWEADIDIKNMSSEEIKYVYIEIVGVNAVGDIVTSDLDFDGNPSVVLSMVGPIPEGEVGGRGLVWDSFFYNKTVANFALQSITIEYMNGIQLRINNNECNLAIQTYNEEKK